MKFHKTLMICLIASVALNSASGSDIKFSNKFPQVQILTASVKIELPRPEKTERQKFIISVSEDNGFICHNFVREKEIKDKLFSLQTKNEIIPELEKKAVEAQPEVSFIESNTVTSIAIGAVLGLVSGFLIADQSK